MKHFVLALTLLALIVGASLLAGHSLARQNDAVTAPLEQALDAARAGDAALARRLAAEASKRWERALPCFSSLLGHEELDVVTHGFARLHEAEDDDFRALCAELLEQLAHLRELDRPLLKNIL